MREKPILYPDLLVDASIPTTDAEALMRTAPSEEPKLPDQGFGGLVMMVEDLEAALAEDERELLRMIVHERLSYREIGQRVGVGKSTVHRAWQRLADKMREQLAGRPEIVNHLRR